MTDNQPNLRTHIITHQGKYLLSWSVLSSTPTTWEWSWTENLPTAARFTKSEAEGLLKRSGAAFMIIPYPAEAPTGQSINITPAAPPAPKRMEYRLFEALDPTTWGPPVGYKPNFDEPQPNIPGTDGTVTEEVKDGALSVNSALDAGWKLYGPPFSHQDRVLQAMVREKP